MVDDIDLRIIGQLKENARASFASIGRQISLSASAVRERVNRMREEGIIKRFMTVFDDAKLGQDIEAFVLLKAYSGRVRNFMSVFASFSEIRECHRITGEPNFLLRVVLKDRLHLQRFIDQLLKYGDTTTHLILSELDH